MSAFRRLTRCAAIVCSWACLSIVGVAAGVDVRVNQDPGSDQQQEVDIAVDPTNPNNIVVVYIDNPNFSVGVSISTNGGVTWTDQQLSFDCDGISNDGDPFIDEELCNGADDDLPPDGLIDEDLCCRIGCDGVDNDLPPDGRIDEERNDLVDNDGDGFTDEDICDGLRHIDPAVTFDSSGNVTVVSIAHEAMATSYIGSSYVAVFRSTNLGASWTTLAPPSQSVWTGAVGVPFLDKTWIAADRVAGSIYQDHVYVAWQQDSPVILEDTRVFVSRYDPVNGIWNGPVRVDNSINDCNEAIYPWVQFNSSRVYAIWRRNTAIGMCGLSSPQFFVDYSDDGGTTWQPDIAGTTYAEIPSSMPIAFHTFRTSNFPNLAVDPFNPSVLFAVYAEDPPGPDPADIMFTWSPNLGLMWLPPIKLNDDLTSFPQYFPTITVHPSPLFGLGLVDVAWQDERNTVGCNGIDDDLPPDGLIDEERLNGIDDDGDFMIDEDVCETQIDVYWTRSAVPGGWNAFSPNARISDVSSSIPLPSTNLSPPFGFLGDYIGLEAAGGVDHIVWNDTRNNGGGQSTDVYFDTMPDIDFDGDGTLDLADCAPGEGGWWAKPTTIQGVALVPGAGTDVIVSWTSQDPTTGSGTGYDIATGLLSDLRSDQDFSKATCLVDQHGDTPYTDTRANPSAGDGYYYLLRGTNTCGSGSYGHTGVADPRFALDGNNPCILL